MVAVTGGVDWVDMSVSGKTGKKGNGPMQDQERLPSDGSEQWERCHMGLHRRLHPKGRQEGVVL